MTRIVLFTGKGGVGKTTVAAATGMRAARGGSRVLVTSTDPAHSLADAFDRPLGDRPTAVADRLDAQQIDAQKRLEEHWREVRDYLVQLLAWGGLGDVQAEELALFPGLDEIFSLVDLRQRVADGGYDLIIVDCAPTAETLRLLALPDALRWYVRRVVAPGRHVAQAVRPVVTRVSDVPVPEDRVFGAVERIHTDLGAVHDMLQDGERSTVRLVVNPERMVIDEAQRTATSLSLFGYAIDAVVVNRLLPDEITDPYLARWKQRHREHLQTVRASFRPTPVLTAPLFDDELIGAEALAELGEVVYDGYDESAVLYDGQPITLHRHTENRDGGDRNGEIWTLSIALPFAAKDDVDLHRRGDELHVKVAGVKRTVPLPAALQRHEVTGAGLSDGRLRVRFATQVAPVASTAGGRR